MSRTADTNSTWSDAARGLEAKGWTGKGGGIYSGHPNPGLVHLEEISNERIEVNVSVGEIVEGELLPVPEYSQYIVQSIYEFRLTFEIQRQEFPYEGRAL